MSWQRVRGHDGVATAFRNAWRRGRMAHAYLFVGPEGVGKKLFATELAKALLCEGRPAATLEACDQCAACKQVEAGTHPDLFVSGRPEESQELPIKVVRELCQNLILKPARGRGKVSLLDDADDLNEESANAFLKTLEEPPPLSTLILIGSAAERQLPTIVSRCQVVRFGPLAADVVAALVREQEWCAPGSLERLVRLSGGSLAQAQALADPALWEFRQTLLQGFAAARPDSVGLGKAWMKFAEEAGKESALQRRRAALALKLLIGLLHDALALSLGGETRTADDADRAPLQELARRCGPEKLLEALERCLEADRHVERRVQLVLALEALTDALGQTVGAG